jgi:hypothetical protein
MRTSNRSTWGFVRLAGLVVSAGLALAACGSGAPASVAPAATPTPTPDPHLAMPATADQVFSALGRSGLRINANNAALGAPGAALIKKINATYEDMPLLVTEFRSAKALRDTTGWDSATPPRQGDPPYAFVGGNILVEWGSASGVRLGTPDPRRQEQAEKLAAILDPLLWPLEQRSIGPVPVRTPAAAAAASPAPSGAPAPSPSSPPASAKP